MEPAAILARVEGSDVAGLYKQVKKYLQPLQGLLGCEGKENSDNNIQIHGLAKRYVSFLAPLLKVCCNSLAKGISETDEAAQRRADELFSTVNFALDCFNALRPCLVGSPYEIEIQRYWMVRRLMAWKRYREAREQCWIVLESLRLHVFRSSTDGVTSSSARKRRGKEREKEEVNLFGEQAEGAAPGLVALMVGLVTDLIICIGESRIKDSGAFWKVVCLVDQLRPWLSASDANSVEKHSDGLFRGLHKCVVFMVTEPTYFTKQLISAICMLVLSHCACSSVKNQLIKVSRGICYQLNCQGPDFSFLVAEIYKATFTTILKDKQLWPIYGENEIFDLVEYYSRHSEATGLKFRKDAKQFLHEIAENIGQVLCFPLAAPIVHVYAFGLGFKDIEFRTCSTGSVGDGGVPEIPKNPMNIDYCDLILLSDTVRIIQSVFGKVKNISEESINVVTSHGKNGTLSCGLEPKSNELSNCHHKWKSRSLIIVFKALEFFWKLSGIYVQQEWESFTTNSTALGSSTLSCAIEQALSLFCQVFVSGLSCNCVSMEGKEQLRKSSQTVLCAATAALKLSLTREEGIQDSYVTISNLILGSCIQVLELKWLMSSAYNIGVHMFNMKQFVRACEPLKLAYMAAWERVSLLYNESLEGNLADGSDPILNDSLSESVSEACAKSVVLVDVLHRSGNPAAREIIEESLLHWSDADARLLKPCSPRPLVKLWVKMISAHCNEMDADEALRDAPTLYSLLSANGCSLIARTIGILLEEEFLAYSKMESEPLSFPQIMKRRILNILLDDVYVSKDFPLERSRVLLEQSKQARLTGAAGLHRCMDYLSEAISLLKKILDEGSEPHFASYNIDHVCHQLAVTYCVHAFCTHEVNANSEMLCGDIRSALKLWASINISKDLSSNEKWESFVEIAIRLLFHIAELLALKGYSCLQFEVQEMILDILVAQKKISPEESCAMLWREGKLSHVLCCVSFSEKFLSGLTEKFGIAVDSIEFWESCLKELPECVMDFHQKLMYDEYLEVKSDRVLPTNSRLDSLSAFQLLKEKASALASSGLKTSESAFVASNLYYILSQKCSGKGHLLEALKYSKESLRIRTKVLRRTFRISDKKTIQFDCNNNAGHRKDSPKVEGIYLEALESVATNDWPGFVDSKKYGDFGRSQWSVLGNYLESLMQVGVLYELVGAGDDAERVFQEGQKISYAQDIPLAQASFGSCLGELYRKRHLWDLAEKELKNSKQVFNRVDMDIMCNLCKVTVEAMVDMRMGDFVRRCLRGNKHVNPQDNFTSAFDIYTSARQNLDAISRRYANGTYLDNKIAMQDGSTCDSHAIQKANVKSGCLSGTSLNKTVPLSGDCLALEDEFCFYDVDKLCQEMNKSNLGESVSHTAKSIKDKRVVRRGQKSSIAHDSNPGNVDSNESCSEARYNVVGFDIASRTRSRLKFTNSHAMVLGEMDLQTPCRTAAQSNRCVTVNDEIDRTLLSGRKKTKQKGQTATGLKSKTSSKNKTCHTECWCLPGIKGSEIHSMQGLITFKWECHRRSLMARLLLQIGKCFVASEKFHKAHETFWQSISILFFYDDRPSCLSSFGDNHHCQLECLGKRTPAGLFFIEQAALLYHISWLCLNKSISYASWTQCCCFVESRALLVTGWLYHAFLICNQMPALFQKVSRLLAIIHLPLASGGIYASPVSSDSKVSANHWAAYFHQASLGTALHQQHLAVLDAKLESYVSDTNKGSHILKSRDLIEKVRQALRLVPESLDDLEPFVMDFFRNVPVPTVVCISLLDSKYASVLGEMSVDASSLAWILLTRFDAKGNPIVLLLPICSYFEGVEKDDTESSSAYSSCTFIDLDGEDFEVKNIEGTSEPKNWINGSYQTVVDVVAGEFGLLLEESRLSMSNALPVGSNEDKNRWWQWRTQLDIRLANLLRKIEDSWLGPWKCLLLGEPSDDSVSAALHSHVQDLKIMLDSMALDIGEGVHVPVDAGLVKVLLGGVSSLTCNEFEEAISYLLGCNGLFGSQNSRSNQMMLVDCCPEQNKKMPMMDHSVCANNLDRSDCQEITCKAAKAFLSIFQNAEAQKNVCRKMHDKESKSVSENKKRISKDENIKEFSQSSNFFPRNLANDFGNSNMVFVEREPVVLVLDANSQVLPWESLPVLRKHEVYRMPSMGSITALMMYRCHSASAHVVDEKNKHVAEGENDAKHDQFGRKSMMSAGTDQMSDLPVVDPYNTFYLLNPSGDLCSTQAAFEDWFRNQQGWEGKTGIVPTPEECILALQNHDLFIYFGHGSGEQYISERNLRRLDYCAAAVLMGCSSGRLSCRGDYEPVGVPFSYLIAGCPSIIANLWDVTDGDIDRFSRALLTRWLESKSSQCSDSNVVEEFQNLTISGPKSARKSVQQRHKGKDERDRSIQLQRPVAEKICVTSVSSQNTRDRLRIGSFIGEGRSTCRLPYLIGASPVCYGVPTAIKSKRTSG